MIPMIRITGAALVALAVTGCAAQPERQAPPGPDSGNRYASDAREDVPAGPAEIRTTSAAVYRGNLDGRIASLLEAATRRPAPQYDLMLAESLAHRARLLGRSEDRESALERVRNVLEQEPGHARARLLQARLLAEVHRFDDALDALDRAAAGGADGNRVARQRAEVLIALGRIAEGSALAEPHLDETLSDLAFRANRLVDQGKPQEADELFIRAQAAYRDSNPYPLAWLHVQHGVLFLRNGDPARARTFFAAAHERLPHYYLATEHLAETLGLLGETERSAELYRQASEQTGDPVFLAALADAERELGRERAAASAEQRARAGFEAWLERRPRAAWQHAAAFFLGRGDPARAVQFARRNAEARQNLGSLLLLARAEKAAGNEAAACEAWQQAQASGLNPPEIEDLSRQFEDC